MTIEEYNVINYALHEAKEATKGNAFRRLAVINAINTLKKVPLTDYKKLTGFKFYKQLDDGCHQFKNSKDDNVADVITMNHELSVGEAQKLLVDYYRNGEI